MTKEYPIVILTWNDAKGAGEWYYWHLEALHGWEHSPIQVSSIGYLIKEDKGGVTIAASVSESQIGNLQYIPKGCITHRHVLRKGKSNVR